MFSNFRKSEIYWIPKENNFRWLYFKVFKFIEEVKDLDYKLDGYCCQNCQYTEYDHSYKGFFNWHKDNDGETDNNEILRRTISVSIQISDPSDYEGGELLIMDDDGCIEKVFKIKGTITVFPSDILHKVEPVTKGNRKSLVLWFLNV